MEKLAEEPTAVEPAKPRLRTHSRKAERKQYEDMHNICVERSGEKQR